MPIILSWMSVKSLASEYKVIEFLLVFGHAIAIAPVMQNELKKLTFVHKQYSNCESLFFPLNLWSPS